MDTQKLTVGYFRERVTSKVDRLRGLCARWQDASDDADDVRCAVGKANILIAGRIRQFSTLIDDCERAEKCGAGAIDRPVTKVTDLQGFWEMVGLQIEDVDKLFLALDPANKEETAEKSAAVTKVVKRVVKAKAADGVGSRKVVKRPASSALKAHISAKRKELKSTDGVDSSAPPTTPNIQVQNCENNDDDGGDRVFDGGFFKVSSPSCATGSPRTLTTARMDLLSPSGFNSRQLRKTPGGSASTTPLAIIRATVNARRSLSPSAVKASLDYEDC